jgi:mono/diheme cytochrome c family protein
MSPDPSRPSGPSPDDPDQGRSAAPLRDSANPFEDGEDEVPAGLPWPVSLLLGLLRLAATGLLVYLTYFFTTTFANRTPPPEPLTPEQEKLARKAADLKDQGRKLISSYGWVDPATRSKARIPVERAMELIVAEANRPVTTPAAPVAAATSSTPSAKPTAPAGAPTGPAVAPAQAVATAPAPPPAPSGMPPEQMYRLVCLACHDTDGRGKIVRSAGMPTIPDLTDPRWHASKTDAELTHSILEGKESVVNGVKLPLMLPMKDKLALAHTDVKDLVAFVRGFKGGTQVVSATPGAAPAAGSGPVASAPAAPAPSTFPATPTVPAPTPASAGPVASATQPTPSPAALSPKPTTTAAPKPAAAATTGVAANPPSPAPAPAAPSPAAPVVAQPLPAALPARNVMTAARAEKLKAAGAIFQTLCIACHGMDGRGTVVRAAMPALPDFSTRDWQTSRTNSQLTTSILEGKGTGMPPWNAKVGAELASDLVLYLRNFGPPDLLAAEPEASATASSMVEFEGKMRSLRQQFDDIEKQLQALSTAPRMP